jgi:hypothetical protein
MANPKLTDAIIEAAITGFEEQKRKIDEQIAELRSMRAGSPAPSTSAPEKQPRRKMSAAGRKAIAAAQRKRWAEKKAGSATPAKAAKPAKKRVLSAEGRAAIVAATKKRWAAKKAADAKAAKK